MSDLNPYEESLAYDLGRAQARIKELEQAERQTYRDALELAKQIDALTELLATTNEQLAAARQDAKEAEAYAEELEKQCEGLFQAGYNNGQALILAEAREERLRWALANLATELTGVIPEPENMRMAIDTAVSAVLAALAPTDAATQKGGDAHDRRLRSHEASPGVTAGADAAQAREAALLEALQWCSGSDDFQEGGKAREGWLRVCAPLLVGEERE